MNVDLERAGKALPLAVAAIYVAGFFVVAYHLAKYGTSSLDLFRVQYLAAGFWCGSTFALYFMWLGILRSYWSWSPFRVPSEEREKDGAPTLRGAFWTFASSFLLNGVSILIALLIDTFIPDFPRRPFLGLLLQLALIDVLLRLSFLIEPIDTPRFEEGKRSLLFLRGPVLGLALVFCIFQFSDAVYPYISFSLGGGQPRSVVFVLNEGAGPTGSLLVRDGAGARTIPYQLLLENENSFIIISPKDGEKVIEFDRKSVAAMIVLEPPKKP